jgi:hypothetical protein
MSLPLALAAVIGLVIIAATVVAVYAIRRGYKVEMRPVPPPKPPAQAAPGIAAVPDRRGATA